LGAIPTLLEVDPDAQKLVKHNKISLGFLVKGGPSATLSFSKGKATMTPGVKKCSIKLNFDNCRGFNDMIDGKGKPKLSGGIWHALFLLKKFTKLTDLLSKYLRPEAKDLEDPEFFERSTTLMLHVIAGAIAAVGNYDKIGSFSASNIVDGTVKLGIADGPMVGIQVQNHRLTAIHESPAVSLSEMTFDSFKTARDLFDGKINAIAAVGLGKVRIGGMVSQVDNVNRILDRVALYLA
jgi:hypothetical protein